MNNMNEIQTIEEQIAALQAQKKALLESERKEALKQVKQSIQSFNFTASELGLSAAGGRAAGRAKREPIYRNPHNANETWAGGAKPKWVQAFLANGGNIEDCRIQK